MSRYRYGRRSSVDGCGEVLALMLILLIPAAIISVMGNVFFPQFHFTLLGGYAIVVALRHLRGLIFI